MTGHQVTTRISGIDHAMYEYAHLAMSSASRDAAWISWPRMHTVATSAVPTTATTTPAATSSE